MSGPVESPVFAVHAACIRGVEACPVTVEISMSDGLPGISILGMADNSVLEARGRIRCALRSAGYTIPRRSMTVNLAPGDMRKTGTGFDLPIAVAVLAASGQIPRRGLDDCLLVGELALDGTVCPVRGEVAYQLLARDRCLNLVSAASAPHIPLEGVSVRGLDHIGALRLGVDEATGACHGSVEPALADAEPDFSDVVGQEIAKRGMAIAAAGELGLLMVGSPGSGKTMLARRMTTILPPIGEREKQEALCIHSVSGEPVDGLLAGRRPFRSPHHSISAAGLIGGGRPVRPGEISLAHGGVLFLDELAEFPSSVLQMLRQPMESGTVRIVRVDGGYTFPARFQLLAASNPCPCGYLGDRQVPCTCTPSAVERYRAKLGGPLADRIDLCLNIMRPDPELIVRGAEGLSSADLRTLVERGRAFRAWREGRRGRGGGPEAITSSPSDGMDEEADRPAVLEGAVSSFALDERASSVLIQLARTGHLTGRGIVRLCRIARTLADMDEAERVGERNVLEASMFRGRTADETS